MPGIEVCHLVDPVVRSPGNKLYQRSLCSFVTGREFRLPHFVFLDLMKIRRCCDAVWRERNDDRLFHPRMALGLHEEYEWAVTLDENLLSECCACGGSIDYRTELSDPHFQARGFPVEVEHPELGESFTYPGAPYQLPKALWAIHRRAPLWASTTPRSVPARLGCPQASWRAWRRRVSCRTELRLSCCHCVSSSVDDCQQSNDNGLRSACGVDNHEAPRHILIAVASIEESKP